jgi:hypothetical protein
MATNWCFGFATSAAVFNVSSWTATPTFSAGYITGGSIFRCADSPDDITLSIPVLGNGDRIGIAFDTGANRMWARKNGGGWMSSAGGTQDPTAGTSGGGSRVVLTGSPFYAFCGMDANTGDSWTTNFASTDWVDAAPSGYTQLA